MMSGHQSCLHLQEDRVHYVYGKISTANIIICTVTNRLYYIIFVFFVIFSLRMLLYILLFKIYIIYVKDILCVHAQSMCNIILLYY